MAPMSSSVVAALRLLGFRNAGTPLLIASTPVSAAQPEENARSRRKASAMPADGLVARLRQQLEVRALGEREGPGDLAVEPEQRHADDASTMNR